MKNKSLTLSKRNKKKATHTKRTDGVIKARGKVEFWEMSAEAALRVSYVS